MSNLLMSGCSEGVTGKRAGMLRSQGGSLSEEC